MSHSKSNCVIALGLTIMDRCSECEKIENAAQEEERAARNRAFASNWSRDYNEMGRKRNGKHPPIVQHVEKLEPETLCECGKKHPAGTSFFVTVQEDKKGGCVGFLLGPYGTHTEALASVERGRKFAAKNDVRSHWYYFGTASIVGPTDRKGMFGK